MIIVLIESIIMVMLKFISLKRDCVCELSWLVKDLIVFLE